MKNGMKNLLDKIDRSLSKVPRWLESVRRPEPPYGRYRYYASSPKESCLYASIEGISVEGLLGLTDKWTEAQKREVLEWIAGCQKPDGYFYCPCCSKEDGDPRQRCDLESNSDGIAFKVACTLYGFGVFPRYPMPNGKENNSDEITLESLDKWLSDIYERSNPYAAGSMVWKACGMRSMRFLWNGIDPMTDPLFAKMMEWLVRKQDTETGLWFPKGDLLNGVNGLLKMRFGTFDLAGIEIPHPEKIVQTILKIQKPDGSFGGACCDWNCVGLLAEIGRRVPERRDDIIAAYRRILPVILTKQRDGGGFCWSEDPAEEPFLKATFVNLCGLISMKCFLEKDDQRLNHIFPNQELRRKLLNGKKG